MTHRRFKDVIDKMPNYMQQLGSCQVITIDGRGRFSRSLPASEGIYVLYEDGKPMYVGRSDRLRARLHEHGRPSSSSESAPFAFNIAREPFRARRPASDTMSRKDLTGDAEFARLFDTAKRRVREMGIRVVEIQDPIEQTIFEVYAHMKLDTTFNSFENH
jgi:hypothetical protein